MANSPSFGVAGTRAAEYCAEYAADETIDVKNINSRTEGCRKMSLFAMAVMKRAEYCAQHAPDGMVDVKNRKC